MTVRVPFADRAATVHVAFARHAIERYNERWRPALTSDRAAAELLRATGHGFVTDHATRHCIRSTPGFFLMIGDICFPLVADPARPDQLLAVTCLAPHVAPKPKPRRHVRASRKAGHRRHRHSVELEAAR